MPLKACSRIRASVGLVGGEAAHVGGHRHDLEKSDATVVAGHPAFEASDRGHHLRGLLATPGCGEELPVRVVGRLDRLFAMGAERPYQTLRHDAEQRRADEIRRHAEIEEPGHRGRRIVGVQGARPTERSRGHSQRVDAQGTASYRSLHTNDAPTAVTRLLDLGVPPYLISSTLLGVMAQRLVRTLCPHCKKPVEAPDDANWQLLTAPWRGEKPAQVMAPVGCLECRMTGYYGRIGLSEIMPMTPNMRRLTTHEADDARIREQAYKEGMKPLRVSGATKIAAGLTTADEVMKVAPLA